LTGPVIGVSARSLTDVVSFTLRSEERTYEIFIDDDVRYSFPPPHLREHVISGVAVRVEIDRRAGRLFATSMRDA
jgi:hypothetical protein